jgi:PAS domain S-box-containing protein
MLVELSPVAMWLSQNDRILMVNSAAAELLGGTAEQIVGRDPYEFIDEKCRHMVREQIEKASQGERLRVADAKCVRLDGELVDVALTVARVPYEGGVAVQVNCLDITERKRTEETLFQQAQELKRSNEDLVRFAYVASHDMREPLRMVTLYAQLLAMRYGDKLGKDADEFIGFIEAGVQRMNALVEDLLAYSRAIPSAERVSQTVNMNSVLQEVLRGCHAKITETGAEITYDPLPNLPGDAVQIGQVLENLISNSLKYRSNHPPRIRISATREGDYWHFSLSDNGIGFKPSYSQQIFELFKRLHKTEYPGTGIGLAICKRIIEQHDGTIWAESEPGHGSVFHFTLPA